MPGITTEVYDAHPHARQREQSWRAVVMLELCIMIEMRQAQNLSIEELEAAFQANLARLWELVGYQYATHEVS